MDIVGAKSVQYQFHKCPELHVLGQSSKENPYDDCYKISDRIEKEAIFESVSGCSNTYVGCLGDIYSIIQITPSPKGGKILRTKKGNLRYGGRNWVTYDLRSLPVPLVKTYFRASYWDGRWRESGNIQYVYIPVSIVEKLLVDSELDREFHVTSIGEVRFCGDIELERSFNVSPHYNKLTWIVYRRFRPNDAADWQSEWCGAHFPDEATARRVGEQWVKYRGKTYCESLTQLKALFPDHPVVPKVEAFEKAEKERRTR